MKQRQPKVVPDIALRGMWRVRWRDGRLTTMSIADAEALQKRLIAIDKFNDDNRCG